MKTRPLNALAWYGALALTSLAALGPFLWLLSTALKSPQENIFATPPRLWPEAPTLENLLAVCQQVPMLQYFVNSLGVSAIAIGATLTTSVLAAYPLSRMRFRGERIATGLILASMLVPFQVVMIPLYQLTLRLGLVRAETDPLNTGLTWVGLSLPFLVSGFGILLVRQAMAGLPKDLEEAAILDGCSSAQVLWHVLLPPLAPTLATLAIFTFLASWGEFLWPSILLSRPEQMTLPVGLVQLQGAFSANWRLIASGAVISMVPVVVGFWAMQRHFIEGQMAGAVKG